jgi:hypothetical protein
MLRRLKAFLVLGVWAVAVPAAAQDPKDKPSGTDQASDQADSEPTQDPIDKPTATDQTAAQANPQPIKPLPSPELRPAEQPEGWHPFITGYFRAPMALGISPRPGPETKVQGGTTFTGAPKTQISYGPTRTVDASYYSFAYTRLQEQDWAELFFHEKKKHAEAVVGFMGYWFQSAGFRVPDAAWFPGMAYLTLDTDVDVTPEVKPNVALTMGAFWPAFGTFAKYDTYTLGRFRQLGEQLKITAQVSPDFNLTFTHGFGTGRDGTFIASVQPPYQATVGLDLIHYENIQLAYKKNFDVSLHYNSQWTRDPNLAQQTIPGKSYAEVSAARLTTIGGELNLSAPVAGHLWVSPSYIKVRNGWALNNSGIEVMHSLGGTGIATNYMAWQNTPSDSTGSGSMVNLGFLYENSLAGIQNKPKESVSHDLTLNVFGLLADASLDLPTGSQLTQNKIKQFKVGADLTLQALNWLGLMVRYDSVNYDLDNAGYIFSAITSRLIFASHFLSSESIYLQYSRYRYGDKMVLAGQWPLQTLGGGPLVAGSAILQGGPYAGQKPDMDVVKVQATVAF